MKRPKLPAKIQRAKTFQEKFELANYGRVLPELERQANTLLYGWTKQKQTGRDYQLHLAAEPIINTFLECVISRDSKALRNLARFLDDWRIETGAADHREAILVTYAEISRSRKQHIPAKEIAALIRHEGSERNLKKLIARHGFVRGKPGRAKGGGKRGKSP